MRTGRTVKSSPRTGSRDHSLDTFHPSIEPSFRVSGYRIPSRAGGRFILLRAPGAGHSPCTPRPSLWSTCGIMERVQHEPGQSMAGFVSSPDFNPAKQIFIRASRCVRRMSTTLPNRTRGRNIGVRTC